MQKKYRKVFYHHRQFLDRQFKNIVKTAALYMPKDIVSGDFYYTYHKKDFNYFALVDCTGHGVPGAMLSFSVNSILHGIIDNLTSYREPSTILQKLNESFSEIYIKGQDVKESFAASLICYLPDHKKIFYSGISQSVAILTNGELAEIKSQSSFLIHNAAMSNQKFSVQTGDRLYFYSDGYYDQKNNITGRRMYKRGLYAQIKNTKHLPVTKQVLALKNYFYEFKGSKEQIDDITLFVIENRIMPAKKNIFLTGFMGSGKTTAGQKLAKLIPAKFIDLDAFIEEKEKTSISLLFEKFGEADFRKIEQDSLEEVIAGEKEAVIALGGGTVCYGDNISKIRSAGCLVYIELPVITLVQRLERAKIKRPLLSSLKQNELLGYVNTKLNERLEFYNQADIKVSGLNLTPHILYQAIREYCK